MNKAFTIIFLCLAYFLNGQKFNNPEDLIYNQESDRYFISNTVDGQIVTSNSKGDLQNFGTKMMGSHGLEIWNGHLLALYKNKVNILNLKSGTLLKTITIEDAKFLKDITAAEDDCFFISDFSDRSIFKLKMTGLNNYELIDWLDTGVIPTGLCYKDGQLYFAQWGQEAGIFQVNVNTKEVETVLVTNYSNLLSLAIGNDNSIYASSWKNNDILKYNLDLNDDPELISDPQVLYPGGLFFNEHTSQLMMTDIGLNRFHNPKMEEKKVNKTSPEMNAFPNPVAYNSLITYHLDHAGEVMIQLFNCKGQLVRTVRQNSSEPGENQFLLEKGGLSNGLYFLHVSSKDKSEAMPITFIQ
ncbi:MAG: T9SS type A sorting domain-containing protein [Flavobacteriales bacterium]|nr:T9SS type A sorting domain-containing protein [Flavobacteriales bacterium]